MVGFATLALEAVIGGSGAALAVVLFRANNNNGCAGRGIRQHSERLAGCHRKQGEAEMSANDLPGKFAQGPSSIELQDHFIRSALLAAIVESSDDAIVSKTLEGRILSWNAGAARVFAHTAAVVLA